MNAKQKVRKANLSKWSAIIQEQQSSGLTIRSWCDQNNISFHAYNYWKHILKEEYVNSILPDIVPIGHQAKVIPVSADSKLELSDSPISNPTPANDVISISLGDIRIDIGNSASDEQIYRIIKAVRYA